jgi:hypothetical protein
LITNDFVPDVVHQELEEVIVVDGEGEAGQVQLLQLVQDDPNLSL